MAIAIGFAKPFLIPLNEGIFRAPVSIYIHAILAFLWVLLFTMQSVFIQTKRYKTHIKLGLSGFFIALGTAFTIIPVGLYAVEKELNLGLGETAISGIVGNVTTAIMFISLVIAALVYRKKPDVHKRLMLLSTVVILWPAWFRFRHYFPTVENPEIWFAVVLADSLILISWAWDKFTNGKIHPSLLYVGLAIILEHTMEVLFFDTQVWRTIAHKLYTFLT
jgi:hypothetical protein